MEARFLFYFLSVLLLKTYDEKTYSTSLPRIGPIFICAP